MTRLFIERTEPVQQLAAHPDTLPLIVQAITKPKSPLSSSTPTPRLGSLFDLPLVPDDTVPRDVISLRPHPHRASAPPSEPPSR